MEIGGSLRPVNTPWLMQDSHISLEKKNGSSERPAQINEITASADEKTKHAQDNKKWSKSDSITQKFIVTALERQPMMHIINCVTAKEMWDKLHAVYENKTDVSIHALQQKWFSLTKDPKDDMSTHISKVEDLCYQLKALGENVSESMTITKILMTIPQKYNHFLSAWDSIDVAHKTLDNLASRLMMEERRVESQENNRDSALVAGSAQRGGFRRNSRGRGEEEIIGLKILIKHSKEMTQRVTYAIKKEIKRKIVGSTQKILIIN